MEDLKERFEKARERVFNLKEKPDNEILLKLYALYKQATEGDVKGERPSVWAMKDYAKYQAWEELKGMPPEKAMEDYIFLVEKTIERYG